MKKRWTALVCAAGLCAGLTLPAAAAEAYVDVPAGAWYASAVNQVTEEGYMTGVDPTHFAPLAQVTRATVVTVLWRMDGSPTPTTASGFSDVADGMWYTQAISWAKEGVQHAVGMGWLEGTDGKLNPGGLASRAQLAAILVRMDMPVMG